MEDATPLPPRTMQANSPTSEVPGGNDPSESVQHQQTSTQESLGREPMFSEWTDEKHSLYLKSMEASFVNELYNSFDLLGWRLQRGQSSDSKLSGKKHASNRVSSGEFKVLRRGCWGKVNFGRHEHQLDRADGCGVLSANPWIRHFRSACRHQVVAPSTLPEKTAFGSLAVCASGTMRLTSAALAGNLEQVPACHSHICYDSVGSGIEVTDQNFIDEDYEGEKKASHADNSKRMKTSTVASPGSDQVVPSSEFSETTIKKKISSRETERSCGGSGNKSANDDCFP